MPLTSNVRPPMSDTEIDEEILASVGASWRKVALIIGEVALAPGFETHEGEDEFDAVARRIEVLVSEGRLVAQGDIRNWRHSELRLP